MVSDWRDQAACLGLDPDLFFPEKNATGTARQAKKVCAVCPVREECGNYAVANSIVHGIWGGHNYRELRRSRRLRVVS